MEYIESTIWLVLTQKVHSHQVTQLNPDLEVRAVGTQTEINIANG